MHRLLTASLAAILASACVSAPPASTDLQPAPWVRASPLTVEAAPAPLIQAWRDAENRDSCAPLTFDPAVVPSDATARTARFSGGWGIAFDREAGPGTSPDGRRCENCGRSSFGIAGAGVDAGGDVYDEWPNRRAWRDGSSAGWGREGGSGDRYLAYLEVAGEGCLYNLWSWESEAHLERLLESLRRVEASP